MCCYLAYWSKGFWPMRNIETFPSKQMYLYLSLVEGKEAEFYHNIVSEMKIYITKKFYRYRWHHDFWQNYSAPSITAEMTSWLLLLSMAAFPLIKVTEILLKSWLVGSLSSQPFFLARAYPSRLTTSVATQWNPPRVSTARGENLSPWVLQASAVSLIFRS